MEQPSAVLPLCPGDLPAPSFPSHRPLLHHLNADTSWLLQIPRPAILSKHTGRQWFNILIDPWLHGSQSDIAGWFSRQWHAEVPRVSSIAKVEELAREIEVVSRELRLGKENQPNLFEKDPDIETIETFIDAVAISHEFTDHCHKQTLLEVHPDVPVFATQKAAKLVASWKHFRHVLETPGFSDSTKDWCVTSVSLLPEWLSIARLVTENDALYFHSALFIVFDVTGTGDKSEAFIYSPHGIKASSLTCVANASPPIKTLAQLHGLHDVSIGSQRQLNLGAHNGLAVQRLLRAQYWIGTHDEVKQASGLISWFLNRKTLRVQDALEEEDQRAAALSFGDLEGEKHKTNRLQNPKFLDIENGEFAVLT